MLFFFFFSSRRRHTRFDCDWSSDVCSSDLMRTHGDKLCMGPCPCRMARAVDCTQQSTRSNWHVNGVDACMYCKMEREPVRHGSLRECWLRYGCRNRPLSNHSSYWLSLSSL